MTQITQIMFVRKLNAPNDELVNSIIGAITARAVEKHYKIISQCDLGLAAPTTLIISVGGDGTMLFAMRLAARHHCVCTGFHAGHLGFLNDFGSDTSLEGSIDSLFDIIQDSDKLRMHTEERSSISILGINDKIVQPHEALALNEIALSRIYSDQILKYTLNINGRNVGTHRANGVLISTPTGSTAYALSAGGAVVYPNAEVIQIVPVAPNTLSSRPLIIPMYAKDNYPTTIKVTIHDADNSIRVDGTKAPYGDKIETIVMQPVLKTRVLHSPSWNFFNTLTNKLGWYSHS